MLISPQCAHMHVSPSERTGSSPEVTFLFDGFHGDAITGMHGAGVKTPSFAAVAAITAGFVGLLQFVNGGILATGMQSETDATGLPKINTWHVGIVMSDDGAVPNEHLHMAPQTAMGIMQRPITSYDTTIVFRKMAGINT
jgi:hypothetical protein